MPRHIQSYVHSDGQIGVLIEFECLDEMSLRTNEFRELCQDLAMQVAAMNPVAISVDDLKGVIPLTHNDSGSDKFYAWKRERCLLTQNFIKKMDETVEDRINEISRRLGEKIRVLRFVRYDVNETQRRALDGKNERGS